jgi:Na+/H+ antiporter NhaD/arsenite permease-like protein
LSALIDNIPYVAVTIPLVARLVADLPGDASVLWWALAMGACLGGNGTAIGASANVTTIGLAEKRGIRIGFAEFTAFGARVTAITLTIASVFLASHIYLGADQTLVWGLVALAALVGGGMLVRRARGATA